MRVNEKYGVRGFQQITSLAAATALTVPSGTEKILLDVEGAAVRWRDDGTNPTTSVGHRLTVGSTLIYEGDLDAIRFIQESAGAKLNVSYYN